MNRVFNLHKIEPPSDTETQNLVLNPPEWAEHWNLFSLSPSTLKIPLSKFILEKFIFDVEDLKKSKKNVSAIYGSACGDLINYVDVQGLSFEKILKEILNFIKQHKNFYEPIDFYKRDQYETIFLDVYENIKNGFFKAQINLKTCSTEQPINLSLNDLEVNINGYTDFRTKDHVIELKTKWNRITKVKAKWQVQWILSNNELSKQKKNFEHEKDADEFIKLKKTKCIKTFVEEHFKMSSAPIVHEPLINDVMQVALYAKATQLKPILIYATNSESYVFDENNCELLHKDNLKKQINRARNLALVRQNILKKTKTIKEIIELVEPPDWESFYYDYGETIVNKGKKLWKM